MHWSFGKYLLSYTYFLIVDNFMFFKNHFHITTDLTGYHYTFIRMAKNFLKGLQNAGEIMEKLIFQKGM